MATWLAVRTSKDTQYLESSAQWTVFTSKLQNKLHDITEHFWSGRFYLLKGREKSQQIPQLTCLRQMFPLFSLP